MHNRIRNLLLCAFFIAMVAAGMFFTSSLFVDKYVMPKWYIAALCACGLMISYVAFSFFTTKPSVDDIINTALPVIAIGCVLQAVYGIWGFANIYLFNGVGPHAGSFNNPAGFASSLSAGLPCLLYFHDNKRKWMKIWAIFAAAIIVAAICISASRSGIISLVVLCLVVLSRRAPAGNNRLQPAVLLVITLIAGFVLYLFKKDSANGRLLIWRCTWNMIKDKPFFGHGWGGFKAHYMNYQARYFESNPGDNAFEMLADNSVRPFNEFLLLLSNFGLAGLGAFLLAAWLLYRTYRQNWAARPLYIPLLCLLSITVFALFSYPLSYPFVWIVGLLSILMIIHRPVSSLKISSFFRNVLKGMIVILLIAVCARVFERMKVEMAWCKVANNALSGKTAQMLLSYKKLSRYLSGNEMFLYNYAAELNVAKQYNESLLIAQKCERVWQSYHIQLLMADNYKQMQRYSDAEACYWKAAYMCPVRFVPLYEIVQIYIATNQPESKIMNLATRIIHKKVKIHSESVSIIKERMNELIKVGAK